MTVLKHSYPTIYWGYFVLLIGISGVIGYEIAMSTYFVSILLIGLAALTCLFLILRNRTYTPLLLIFITGLEQFRLESLGSIGTLSKLGGLIVFALYIVEVMTNKAKPSFKIKFTSQTIFQILFVVYASLSVTWALFYERAITRAGTFGILVVFMLLILHFVQGEADLYNFSKGLIVYGVVISLYGLWDFIFVNGMQLTNAARTTALNGNANIAALYIAMTAGALLGITSVQTSKKSLALLFIIYLVFVAGIAATGSRSGFITLGAVTVISILFQIKRWRRTLLMLLAIGLGLGLLYQVFPGIFDLLQGRFTGSLRDDPTGNRLDLALISLQIFYRNPILGIGLDSFAADPLNSTGILIPHGMYHGVLAEGGLIGLSLMLSYYVIAVTTLIKLRKKAMTEQNKRLLAVANSVLFAFTAILISGLSSNEEYGKFTWLLLSLIAAAKTNCLTKPFNFSNSSNPKLQGRPLASPAKI